MLKFIYEKTKEILEEEDFVKFTADDEAFTFTCNQFDSPILLKICGHCHGELDSPPLAERIEKNNAIRRKAEAENIGVHSIGFIAHKLEDKSLLECCLEGMLKWILLDIRKNFFNFEYSYAVSCTGGCLTIGKYHRRSFGEISIVIKDGSLRSYITTIVEGWSFHIGELKQLSKYTLEELEDLNIFELIEEEKIGE